MPTDAPWAVLRRVLANQALRRVLPAYLLFNAAEFGTWVSILLYAYDRTGAASVGVVALVQLVPAAIVAPAAASLGDRFPRQRVLAAATCSRRARSWPRRQRCTPSCRLSWSMVSRPLRRRRSS